MSSRPKLKVGIVGFGFMGRAHLAAWRAADAAGFASEVVAVSDRPEVLASVDAQGLRAFEKPEELFDDRSIHVVSICTPTPSHVALAAAALAAGKHVLVEKPIAIHSADADRLADVALRAKTYGMPAMCVRFWPGWDWLAQRIRAGTFGTVRSAVFRRLNSRPQWSKGFYEDYAQSGGALFDLHVHDADFVRWVFGAPARVTAIGTLDHVSAVYHFPKGPPHVVAEGGWDHAGGFPFKMAYTVAFDQATAEYDSSRSPPLLLARDGKLEEVPLEPTNGYDGEVRHLCDVIAGKADLAATLGQAAALTRMLEAELKSLQSGAAVKLA